MTDLFEHKVALVTGAASGIGRASAQAFAREGAKVVVSDVALEGGQESVEMIRKAGGEALFVKCDVASMAEVEALIMKAIETYGQLDYAHNNAGIGGNLASTADCTKEDWARVMNVNLNGVWYCMKYEILHMLKQGSGAIVNTSSIGGLHGVRNYPAYCASKHGVIGLTKSAALEYAKKGIRINTLCPGFTHTGMPEVEDARYSDAEFLGRHVVGRVGNPEEQAEAVVWLCSDLASFVNGHAMIVDGGRMAL